MWHPVAVPRADLERGWEHLETGNVISRIHRGFHRISAALAAPVLLVAGWFAGDELWQAWETSGLPPERMLNWD